MTPKGFWSYARGDDDHLDQRLTVLRDRVAGEISMLLGEEVGMFQDIYDIRTGDEWESMLRAELTDASFMIPVLTPRYFSRPWCRDEVMSYLRLAREAGRTPLLFPIYFVEDRAYEQGAYDDVRQELSRFQFFDYRKLRFESEPTKIDQAIHKFAVDVVDRLAALETAPSARRPVVQEEDAKETVEPEPMLGSHEAKQEAVADNAEALKSNLEEIDRSDAAPRSNPIERASPATLQASTEPEQALAPGLAEAAASRQDDMPRAKRKDASSNREMARPVDETESRSAWLQLALVAIADILSNALLIPFADHALGWGSYVTAAVFKENFYSLEIVIRPLLIMFFLYYFRKDPTKRLFNVSVQGVGLVFLIMFLAANVRYWIDVLVFQRNQFYWQDGLPESLVGSFLCLLVLGVLLFVVERISRRSRRL